MPDQQQELAARLRELAELVERRPPSKVDINFSKPEPIGYDEGDGFVKYIEREGYEHLKIELHW